MAVIKIQRWWLDKKSQAQRLFKFARRHLAAFRLQRVWRRYKEINSFHHQIKTKSVKIVQKYIRGFIAREQLYRELKFDMLKPSLRYLGTFTGKIYESSQIKIAYAWRKYKREKEKKAQ